MSINYNDYNISPEYVDFIIGYGEKPCSWVPPMNRKGTRLISAPYKVIIMNFAS